MSLSDRLQSVYCLPHRWCQANILPVSLTFVWDFTTVLINKLEGLQFFWLQSTGAMDLVAMVWGAENFLESYSWSLVSYLAFLEDFLFLHWFGFGKMPAG